MLDIEIRLLLDKFKKYVPFDLFFGNDFSSFCNHKNCYKILDLRSMAYCAVGSAESSGGRSIILAQSSYSYRSIDSALTEAYYKNIPIIVINILYDKSFNNEYLNDTAPANLYIRKEDCHKSTIVDETIKSVHSIAMRKKKPVVLNVVADCKIASCEKIDKINYELCFDSKFNFYVVNNTLFNSVPNIIPISGIVGCISFAVGCAIADNSSSFACIVDINQLKSDLNSFGLRDYPQNLCVCVINNDFQNNSIKQLLDSLSFIIHEKGEYLCIEKKK